MDKNKILISIAAVILMILIILIIIVKLPKGSQKLIRNNSKTSETTTQKNEERINYIEEISVYNAAEYMDMSTIKDFEKEYKIKVVYRLCKKLKQI